MTTRVNAVAQWVVAFLIMIGLGLIIWGLVEATNNQPFEYTVTCQPIIRVISISTDSDTGLITFTCTNLQGEVLLYEHINVAEFNRLIYGEPQRIFAPKDGKIFDNQ